MRGRTSITLIALVSASLFVTGCSALTGYQNSGAKTDSDEAAGLLAPFFRAASGQKPSDVGEDTDSDFVAHSDRRR